MNSHSEIDYFLERRLKPRFACDYAALVQSCEENGKIFQIRGKAVDLSRNGVNIVLNREISTGTELSISLAFNTQSLKLGTSSLVVHGTVVRCEIQSEAVYNIAVEFQEFRFV